MAGVGAELLGVAGPSPLSANDASLVELGRFHLMLWGGFAALALLYARLRGLRPLSRKETWGCGYAAPNSRMQYSARSFAELMSEHVLPRSLRPKVVRAPTTGLFPAASQLSTDYGDPLTRKVYEPAFARWVGRLSSFHWVQRGVLHLYLLYVLIAVLLGLAWVSLGWGGR
jgi:hypothetical protein